MVTVKPQIGQGYGIIKINDSSYCVLYKLNAHIKDSY